jgi:hypothetical protein
MIKKLKNSLFASLMLGIILSGCVKEKLVIQEIEKEYSWKAHPSFRFSNKIIYNSLSTDSYLYFYGTEYFTRLDSNHESTTQYYNSYNNFLKQPIGKLFIPEVKPGFPYLIIRSISNPAENIAGISLKFTDIDKSFQGLAMDYFYQNEAVTAINDQNQLLIPIYTNEDPYAYLAFYQIGCIYKDYGGGVHQVDTAYVRKIHIKTPFDNTGQVFKIQSIKDNFFVSNFRTTFLIRPNGTYSKVLDAGIKQFFKLHGNLYASGRDGHIYQSNDSGETWKQAYNGALPVQSDAFNVGNDTFIYADDKIGQLTIQSDQIFVKELVNDGLEGNQITSVNQFKDRVYVTTLSGVYSKPYSQFLTYKAK